MSTGVELGSHLRIHRDVDLLFVGHQRVSLLDLFDDPVLERISDDSSTNADHPLLGHLGEVWIVRQVLLKPRLIGGEGQDLLNRQIPVLWDVQSLDLVHRNVGLPLGQDIFQLFNTR